MKVFSLILLALTLSSGIWADAAIDEIYTAYAEGRIDEARSKLQALPTISARDGNRLFLSALLEKEAAPAIEKLNASLKSNIDGKYLEEASYRLMQLAEAKGDTISVVEMGKSYLDNWELGRYRQQVLASLAAHTAGQSKEQGRYLDLLIDEASGAYYGQFARLVKANFAFDKGQYDTAERLCRKVNNAADDNLSAASLVILSRIGLKKNDTERALFNYNILHEQFRHAIGEENLLDALKLISDSRSGEEQTEVFEGITYSVQVGVFAEKENAKRMEKRIEGYGYKVDIKQRMISGKSYYVVLAGKFKTMKDARTAKARLELGEDQIFKVAVNNEN
ncbi:MAG: SPOR domain-containing protein [Candidatus Zixiibacteriota bacterium]